MLSAALRLAVDHNPGFVIAAAAICGLGGLLLALVIREAQKAPGAAPGWRLGVAVVAGITVWTTHFMAMLGYRTDIVLQYDLLQTLGSGVAAILSVGWPLALSLAVRGVAARAALGAVAGVGIGVMHLIGMAAIVGCTQTQSLAANGLACLVGAAFLALARGLPARLNPPWATCLLFVAAVCGTHFISIAGTLIVGQSVTASLADSQIELSLFTATGAGLLFVATFFVLVTERRFEAQARSHSETLATTLENMSNGILKIAHDETIRLYNARLLTLLKLDPSALATGSSLTEFVATVGRANGWDEARIARVVANHRVWMAASEATSVEHLFEDGRILSITCQPVADGMILTYDDVTKARQAQSQISHLAFHDPLTGLANRRALRDRLADDFGPGHAFTLLLVDLDNFKQVNDTFGHGIGDRLLVGVAARLTEGVGEAGFVARLGGDEMAVIVPGTAALAIAERLVAAISEPFLIGDLSIVVGCSIGLCRSEDALEPDDLMRRADLALYEAKHRGRGRVAAYRAGMIEAISERNRLEADLRIAVAEKQFHLVYQPVVGMLDGEVFGYEALIRWEHPVRGMLSPATFIPLAEETGLIVAIGEWVLEEACRQAASWPAHQHVAVNVSPVQFRSARLLAQITRALALSGLAPGRLEIELTETALVEDGRAIAHTLRTIRALGIRIAMDDFGTGYSSLAHLRDFPLDRIKIDRSFVAGALRDTHSLAVVKAIIQMGQDMAIQTQAEGVERTEQMDLLRTLGCDSVQGYLTGRPERQDAPAAAVREAA